MQVKTIKKIISKKMIDWLETIPNEKLRSDVKKKILVSGGCITSLFQGLPVNDYDVYIQDMDVHQTGSALLPRNNYHRC
jgi:hypothetical protein